MGGNINDGSELEGLIKEIEVLLIPKGFTVELRKKVYTADKKPLGEFDILISGKLGTGSIKWLIECRDRPSEGPAPKDWITELFGEKQLFHFDKVTAVSTTGFSSGATESAPQLGIELHEVKHLTSRDVIEWLGQMELTVRVNASDLRGAFLGLPEGTKPEELKAVNDTTKGKSSNDKFLIFTRTGKLISLSEAWEMARNHAPYIFNGVQPNGEKKAVELTVDLPDAGTRFQIETEFGIIDIVRITFQVYLSVTEEQVPISRVTTITEPIKKEVISQSQKFEYKVQDKTISLKYHQFPDFQDSIVAIRIEPDKKK
jgi:hypothetical protein